MNIDFVLALNLLVLTLILGQELVRKLDVSRYSEILPLTCLLNGIVLVASILFYGGVEQESGDILGFLAVMLASINFFGACLEICKSRQCHKGEGI